MESKIVIGSAAKLTVATLLSLGTTNALLHSPGNTRSLIENKHW